MEESFGTIWQVPPINIEHIRTSEEMMVSELIISQYKDLQNLGTDYIKDNGVNDRTLFEFITYVNENYLPIINIESILDTPNYTQIIGRFIYSFICIDMIQYIIPKTMNGLGIKEPSEFATVNESALKEHMLRVIKIKIDALKDLINKAYSKEVYHELLKWVFFIDLIDNDISKFIENYIIPVCERYAVDIIANT